MFDGRGSGVVREGFCHEADGAAEAEEKGTAFGEFASFAGAVFDGAEEFFLMIGKPCEEFPGAAVFETVDVAAFFPVSGGTVGGGEVAGVQFFDEFHGIPLIPMTPFGVIFDILYTTYIIMSI